MKRSGISSKFIGQKIILGFLFLLMVGCSGVLQTPVSTSKHLLLGNPSNAIASAADNYLMEKPQYALSYNRSKQIPNWVSWQLNQTWLGTVPRRNDFRPDDSLPADWQRVTPSDYNGSGYDRGHMVPSGDRTQNPVDNSATFLMTNIVPQAPDNNQGPWAELETYCRDLVEQGKELYIIAGGYGRKPALSKAKITPPARLWKAIVVLDRPGAGIESIHSNTRVIAVDLPNVQGIRDRDWRTFRGTIDQIEAATGYDLLSNVPEAIQRVLEQQVDDR